MDQLSRFFLRYRRWLVALCAGIAVWSALTAVTAEPTRTPVLVAARDLPSGTELTANDLAEVAFPPDAVPEALLDREQSLGRLVAGPMRRGEVITDRRAVEPRNLADGERLVAIETSGATAQLLRPGDQVDVIVIDSGHESGHAAGTRTLAEAVSVVTIVEPREQESWTVGVAADEKTARALSHASVGSVLQVLPVPVS